MKKITFKNVEPLDFRTKEAYKTLRSNIGFCGSDVKVIAVTSTVPNEGKSNVSLHLAMSMAEAGYKVCFVDADLRKSVLVGKYKVGQVKDGLTNYLSGLLELSECMCETDDENLYCIFSGPVPPNPCELLGNKKFTAMLEYMKKNFDYVVVDTPPLGSVIDSAVVSQSCDGAVIVIEHNGVSRRQIKKTKEQLEKSGCRILGAVLNKVDMKAGGYYNNYYNKYYGDYYAKNE
ncbi:MAG: polysaccharide biosynthesis tyrosine autokinase [Lachnospiraceae bacterium]|nr:polysaccharide biosynthesis tyrosine autokinase [Lachnospiraceae bacterium]MBQ2406111.1 polysaccharide biosynthesis tyrosine autokinase [Lachnospiraceae bacterium]MEE0920327.1 polysaccharide biosynthesis tyrosine autokinase [Lachnospiraceae bacterium]